MRNRLDDKLYAYGLLVRAGQLGEGLHSGECEQRPSLPPGRMASCGGGNRRLRDGPSEAAARVRRERATKKARIHGAVEGTVANSFGPLYAGSPAGVPKFQLRRGGPRRQGAGEMTRRRLPPKVYLNPASVWELLDQRNISQNQPARLSGFPRDTLKPTYMDDPKDDTCLPWFRIPRRSGDGQGVGAGAPHRGQLGRFQPGNLSIVLREDRLDASTAH